MQVAISLLYSRNSIACGPRSVLMSLPLCVSGSPTLGRLLGLGALDSLATASANSLRTSTMYTLMVADVAAFGMPRIWQCML